MGGEKLSTKSSARKHKAGAWRPSIATACNRRRSRMLWLEQRSGLADRCHEKEEKTNGEKRFKPLPLQGGQQNNNQRKRTRGSLSNQPGWSLKGPKGRLPDRAAEPPDRHGNGRRVLQEGQAQGREGVRRITGQVASKVREASRNSRLGKSACPQLVDWWIGGLGSGTPGS